MIIGQTSGHDPKKFENVEKPGVIESYVEEFQRAPAKECQKLHLGLLHKVKLVKQARNQENTRLTKYFIFCRRKSRISFDSSSSKAARPTNLITRGKRTRAGS